MIGMLDGEIECVDTRCGSMCLDIVGETRRGKWRVECAICGTGFETRAVPSHIEHKEEVFRFWDGRFSGLTIDEVSKEPRGLDYITATAADHKRQAVKDACKTWLAQNRTTE